MKPFINLDEVALTRDIAQGENFAAKMGPISTLIGAKKLGYNLTVVPPGKRAFPFHNHHANEELFVIIAGSGMLRFGKDEYAVRVGDVIACPPGDAEVAHQLKNTGSDELKYLAVSTTIDTDIYQYPDAGKVGMTGGRQFGQTPPSASFSSKFYIESTDVDYWQGEQ